MPEKMSDFFDNRALGYEDHMRQNITDFDHFYQTAAEPIPCQESKLQILDLGAGTGLEMDILLPRLPKAQFTIIDISSVMLQNLQNKLSEYSSQLNIFNMSYLDYEFPDQYFDYIITVQSLHHLLFSDKVKLYEKIARSLKPQGLFIEADFIVDDELEKEYLKKYHEAISQYPETLPAEFHLDIPLSWESTKKLLQKAGLKLQNIASQTRYASIYSATPI
jgi:tRNA (cmo5U34)-methyltransferase